MPFSNNNSDKLDAKARLFELIDNLSDDQLLALLKIVDELPLKTDRKELRKLCPQKINFTVQDHDFKGAIHDISYSGVLIETGKSFSIGSDVSLLFSIHGIPDPIQITGEIVRTSPLGIGVRFKNLTQRLEDMIKSLVDSC